MLQLRQVAGSTVTNAVYPRQSITPVGSSPFLAPAERTKQPLEILGFFLLNVYLFIVISRVFDVNLSALRIPMVFFVLMALGIFAGSPGQAMQSRFTLILTLMLGWIGVTVLFSTWRGGSMEYWRDSLQSFVLAIAIMAGATTFKDCIRLITTIAWALVTAALLSFKFGVDLEGRLALYQGTYGDPNQFAMALLIGLPFWFLILKRGSALKKVFCGLCICVIIYVFLRTGSRGGAIGLAITGLFMVWQASMKQRAVVFLLSVTLLVSAFLLLPDYLRARYFTFLTPQSEAVGREGERLGADAASAAGRLQLIWDAIDMTIHNPLVGVGPGQFAMRRWEAAKGEGRGNVGNFVTHNSYTQMSSETGIPGLMILIALLYGCFKVIGSVLRTGRSREYQVPREVLDAGIFLRLALIALSVCAFFLSVGYSQLFYIMAAITAAYYHAAQKNGPLWKIAPAIPASYPAHQIPLPVQSAIQPASSSLLNSARRRT